MKKHLRLVAGPILALLITAFAFAASTGTASADPAAINGHNCAGAVVSSVAAPGLGAVVSALADAQVVDNIGLADCGQDNRNNP